MENKIKSDFEKTFKSFKKDYLIEKKAHLNNFLKKGFPNRKLENWKFSDLDQVINKNIGQLNFHNDFSIDHKLDSSIHTKVFEHNKITIVNGKLQKMSHILNMAVFPGNQGGPLMHVIAGKAIAFEEAQQPSFKKYMTQVRNNAKAMANSFLRLDYNLISGGTDNHMMLIDLRNKDISGKDAELALVKADITANKNMVPFDDKSPFVTSGIRVGTAAITTRGLKEDQMGEIVNMIDRVILNYNDDLIISEVANQVNALMRGRPLFNS